MNYLHPLPPHLVKVAAQFEEFANGAAQCRAKLSDGSVFDGLLVSNATAVIAARGHSQLPFNISDVVELYQEPEDHSPHERGGWQFFDNWKP